MSYNLRDAIEYLVDLADDAREPHVVDINVG